MAYVGQPPFQEFTNPPTKDSFTGDGSTTTFDMAKAVPSGSVNALEVYVNNVRQEPGTGKAFTLGVDGSGDHKRITFTAAPASSAAIYVINDKTNSTITAPLVTDLNGVELIFDVDGDTSITADTDDRIDFKIGNVEHISINNSSGDTVIKPMVDGKDIVFQQYDGNKILEINDANFVSISGADAGPGELRFYEDTDLGALYTGFKAGNVTSSVSYVLPLADGTSGYALTTDGSGTLSWTIMSANTPTSADGQALGSASLEWSDLFLADSGTVTFGNDQDTILTHTDGSGLTLNSTNKLMFNDASQFVQGSSATVLSIGATDEIDLTATAIDINGTCDVSGAFTTGSTIVATSTIQGTSITATTSFLPDAQDGAALGTTSLQFSDLFLADSAVIGMGDDNEVTITHVPDTGILINSDNVIQFNDASQNIGAPSNAILDINATDEIELNATLVDINANVEISGTATTTGVHTFSATPVFPDGSLALADLDIDGGTDIGEAIVDADLFIIDNGAGGTNRKTTASRIKTYAATSGAVTGITSALNTSLVLGRDADNDIDFTADNIITFRAAAVDQVKLIDNVFSPVADSDVDLGTNSLRFKDAYIDTITTTGAITASGIVTGTGFTAGSAVLAEAELELLDGLTAGTAIASKVVTTDGSIDTTGQRNLTITGELDAATLDISGAIDVAGAAVLHGAVTQSGGVLTQDGGAVFNEASADVDFRVESNDSSAMLFVDGGNNRVGVGTNAPSVELHIDQAAGEITEIRASAASIYTKLIADDASGFNELDFSTTLLVKEAGTEVMRIIAGEISTGAEAAPDVNAGGLCLDQNATDDAILTFKSSDVAHGITNNVETDTYLYAGKNNAASGGAQIGGYSEATRGMSLYGVYTTSTTGKASDSTAGLSLIASKKNGADITNAASNDNLVSIVQYDTTAFIFDKEGDFHADSSSTTFDAYDDAQLARAWDLTHNRGVIESKFDKFVAYNHEKLADLQLVGREKDGTPNHFINVTGFQRLHNGAIWQQYEKHNQLLEAVYDLATIAVGKDKADAILEKHEVKRLN